MRLTWLLCSIIFGMSLNLGDSGIQVTKPSSPEFRYIPAGTDLFGMNITVSKTDSGDRFQLEVRFTVPADESSEDFNLVTIYGLQVLDGKRSDLPSGTFPSVHGNWRSGDQVTLNVNLPKQFGDPDKGWNLTFCIGTGERCFPSPNLLKPLHTTGNISELLNSLKAALESNSNVRATRLDFHLESTRSFRITGIRGCTFTLSRDAAILDMYHDGGETNTKANVELANLSSDVQLNEHSYSTDGKQNWVPRSSWLLSASVVQGRQPISLEVTNRSFPGRIHESSSEAAVLEIEFMDSDSAGVVARILKLAINACSHPNQND